MAAVVYALLLAGCGGDDTASQAYQQACHGEPLPDQQAIYQAEADGYRINSRYRCIDRQSWQEVQAAMARLEHARRPEVRARAEAAADAEHAQRLARIAARAAAREQAQVAVAPQVLQPVDANRGSREQLAAVCGVDHDGAEAIVLARQQGGPFTDWADLVHRVVPFSAAQSAVAASRCGLTVNGHSLAGAEPAAND
ncbi:MAG: ComEA family DNA-binding protein [Stenotrophomonas sp.]